METITVQYVQTGRKLVLFKEGADLSKYENVRAYQFNTRPDNAGLNLKTVQRIVSAPGSAAYSPEYVFAYAETHCVSFTDPEGNVHEKPSAADFEAIDRRILATYTARADGSEGLTKEELESLKKPETPETGV